MSSGYLCIVGSQCSLSYAGQQSCLGDVYAKELERTFALSQSVSALWRCRDTSHKECTYSSRGTSAAEVSGQGAAAAESWPSSWTSRGSLENWASPRQGGLRAGDGSTARHLVQSG